MTLKYDVESHYIAEVDESSQKIGVFRMVRRGQRTRLKCKKCGHTVHEQFTPVGKLPPLLDNEALPDYPCKKCET